MLLHIADTAQKHTGCSSFNIVELLHLNVNITRQLNPHQDMHILFALRVQYSCALVPNFIDNTEIFSFLSKTPAAQEMMHKTK